MKPIARILFTLLCGASLLASCKADIDFPTEGEAPDQVIQLPDGTLRVPLNLLMPQPTEVQTRTTKPAEEQKITSIWVMVFEATNAADDANGNKLLQLARGVINSDPNQTVSGKAYVDLKGYANPCQIRVACNLKGTQLTTVDNYRTVTDGGAVTTMGDYKSLALSLDSYYDISAGKSPGTTLSAPYTMSGRYFLNSIDIVSTTHLSIPLKMVAARMDINNTASGFTFIDATVVNARTQGNLYETTLPVNSGLSVQYAAITTTTDKISPIYLFENNGNGGSGQGTNPTCVVVKGKNGSYSEGYYKFAIRYLKAPDVAPNYTYDIVRNTLYQVNITSVKGPGYSNITDAIAHSAQNIEYTVTALDASAHDLVTTNGEYYLGVSNSEYILYSDQNEMSKVPVTITYNAPTLSTAPQVTLSSTLGLSFTGGVGYNYSSNIATLDNTGGGVKTINLNMNLSTLFTPDMTGSLTIRVGNLEKVVTIKRKSQLVYFPLVTDDFATSEYVVAERANPADTWLQIGTNGTSFSTAATVQSTGSGIYLKPDAWNNSSVPRPTADLYLARSNQNGRVKATFRQMKKIIDGGTYPAGVSAYTGAFWSKDQSGERVIRIPMGANTANLGRWTIAVEWMDGLWNANDIVINAPSQSTMPLTTTDLPDLNAESAGSTSWIASATSTPVNGTAINAPASDPRNYVYFRVGLKSKFSASGAYSATPNYATTFPARYAVLLLAYGTPTKVQRLFLRQGEDADYIRTEPDSPIFTTRNVLSSAGVENGTLAAYPTQAGGFKKWTNLSTLWNASNTNVTGFASDNNSGSILNVCPKDYKIPSYQALGYTVFSSELGALTSSPVLSYWGYYADGFFDRRLLVGESVDVNAATIAHAGRLFINPATSHSIFLPAAGNRLSDTATSSLGTFGYYWSTSPYSSGYSNSLYLNSAGGVGHRSESVSIGYSIRCVRKPSIGGTQPPGDAPYVPW